MQPEEYCRAHSLPPPLKCSTQSEDVGAILESLRATVLHPFVQMIQRFRLLIGAQAAIARPLLPGLLLADWQGHDVRAVPNCDRVHRVCLCVKLRTGLSLPSYVLYKRYSKSA